MALIITDDTQAKTQMTADELLIDTFKKFF